MAAQNPAATVDDLPRRGGEAAIAVAAHEGTPAAAREKAQVLALALVGHGQARVAGEAAHALLVSPPSGKERRSSSAGSRASM